MRRTARRELRPEDLSGMSFAQYIRDSTADQAEGFGPEIQRRANHAFAERYGLLDSHLLYEEYVSAGSVRGREQLLRAIQDLRDGKYTVLLVAWTHRFSRSTADAATLRRQIAEAGGILVYSAQGMISGQRSSRVGENILHVIDQEYRDNLGDLVTQALQAKYEAGGANGVPPLGSKHIYLRRDGSLAEGPERHTQAMRVLDDKTLPIVRALLTHYVEEGSYRTTAEWLNDHGYHTREGTAFTFSGVRDIVRNPFYGPEEIVRYHPGQLDEQLRPTPKDQHIFPDAIHDLWKAAQVKRDISPARSGPSKPAYVYPLHATLRCSTCGSVYHGQAKNNQRYSRHAGPDNGCTPPRMISSDLLEDQLTEALCQVQIPTDWQTQIVRLLKEPRHDDAPREQDRIQKQIERLRYQHLCDAIDDETFLREYRALKARLDALPTRALTRLEEYREPATLMQTFGGLLAHPVVRTRPDAMKQFRRFCEVGFARIAVDGRKLVSMQPRPRYAELFAVGLAQKRSVKGISHGPGNCAVERT